jgi:hypothetical protein
MRSFEIDDIVENEDGSATITMTLDYDTLLVFARKGVLAALVEAAEKTVNENME